MAKTETVHTRVTGDIKEKADKIFHRLGLTTSQAITLFFFFFLNKYGLPFELLFPDVESVFFFSFSFFFFYSHFQGM